MAYAPTSDKLRENEIQAQQGAGVAQAPSAGIVSPAASGAVSANQAQPVGTGGQTGWVNIQKYIDANRGNTSTASALKDYASPVLQNERAAATAQATQVKDAAKAEGNKVVGVDQASQMISGLYKDNPAQASGGMVKTNPYDASVRNRPDFSADVAAGSREVTQPKYGYTDTVNSLKDSLAASFGGPTDFTYNTGDDYNTIGRAVNAGGDWSTILNTIYDKSAGGSMASGAKSLQKQLDQENEALNATKGDLTSQYKALSDYLSSLDSGTDAELAKYKSDFGTAQSGLRDYLGGASGTIMGGLNKAAEDANADYEKQIEAMRNSNGYKNMDVVWRNGGPGQTAENVQGQDLEKMKYNAIREALGLDKLADAPAYKPTLSVTKKKKNAPKLAATSNNYGYRGR